MEEINNAIQTVALSLLGSITAMILLVIYVLPKTSLFKNLNLEAVSGKIDNQNLFSGNKNKSEMIGKKGITITPLKPNGKIKIDNKIFEAISTIGFIDSNTDIIVIEETSFELKVSPISDIENC